MVGLLAGALAASCGPKRVAEPSRPGQDLVAGPSRPGQDLVVLLPGEPDSPGGASVSNQQGTVDLAVERDATLVTANRQPSRVVTMSEAEVRQIFGDALSALPLPPRHFTLFFRFESDELTDEARALLPEVLHAATERPVPDVVAVGHADTTGTSASNVELGLKRAMAIRNLLVDAGLDVSSIEVASHGEADLLVKTPDETYEPRNRRVEISVR